jgi:hypothetical protein
MLREWKAQRKQLQSQSKLDVVSYFLLQPGQSLARHEAMPHHTKDFPDSILCRSGRRAVETVICVFLFSTIKAFSLALAHT